MGRVGTASRHSFQYGVRPLLTDINRKRSDPILNPACCPSALGRAAIAIAAVRRRRSEPHPAQRRARRARPTRDNPPIPRIRINDALRYVNRGIVVVMKYLLLIAFMMSLCACSTTSGRGDGYWRHPAGQAPTSGSFLERSRSGPQQAPTDFRNFQPPK